MTDQWLGNWGAGNKKKKKEKGEKENAIYFLVVMARNSRRLQQNRCFTVM